MDTKSVLWAASATTARQVLPTAAAGGGSILSEAIGCFWVKGVRFPLWGQPSSVGKLKFVKEVVGAMIIRGGRWVGRGRMWS